MFGGVLLSHPVPRAVPSAQTGLASGFGMGPGVSPSLWPPKHYRDINTGTHPHQLGGLRVVWSPLGNRIVDALNTVPTEHCHRVCRSEVTSYRLISTGQLHALPH